MCVNLDLLKSGKLHGPHLSLDQRMIFPLVAIYGERERILKGSPEPQPDLGSHTLMTHLNGYNSLIIKH